MMNEEHLFDQEDINYLRKYGMELPKPVVDKSPYHCPRCRTSLRLKWGSYGPFLACPRFPDCHYTMSLPEPSPTNPYFQSYKEVKCEKCDGTGLLPFEKNGEIIPHAYIYCKCHEEEPGSDFRLPSDFDFPISYDFYRFLCQYYRWEDPEPLYGSVL